MAEITGFGAVSSLGRGAARLWEAMADGRDGLVPIRRFDPSEVGVAIAGMIPDRNERAHAAPGPVSCAELAIEAAREAWAHAELDRVPRERIALVFGSSLGDSDVAIQRITEIVGNALGIAGPRLTVTTACASSANALGLALDLVRLRVADAVIAGGADVLTPLVLAGFHALGVLAAGKCAPFSEPAGTTLAEGAGFVVMERARMSPRAELLGYGLSVDAFHDTGPDPTGAGVTRALRAALAHSGVASDAIDYINAHGTGTRANDPAEWRAIEHVLGDRAVHVPVSSSKSFLGHAQGAAGVLETIATLVAIEHGALPPTQRYTVARPHSPRDAVGQATARPGSWQTAISTSSGFGGANCAVVLGRRHGDVEPARRRVAISGLGAIGPHGLALPSVMTGRCGRVPPFAVDAVVPSIDPRGLDPTTRYLAAAIGTALDAARVRLVAEERDRSGLVVGLAMASRESDTALHATIARHGYRGLSASLFARQVVNAAPGTCARLFGLRGAHSVVSAGAATGLFAMIYAGELLATRPELARIVAVGADELPGGPIAPDASEGAVAAVLTAEPGAVELAGWSVAGPGRIADAAERALASAQLSCPDRTIDLGDVTHALGTSDGYTSAATFALATSAILAGEARHVLITCAGGASADCALVLHRGDSR